jgi:lipid-A-disaccharide synthase
MRIFISAGEPSGDMHGDNLARALIAADPQCDPYGLGGPRMRAAGVDLLYPLAEHAVMGFIRVVQVVPALSDLLDRVTDAWHRRRPDAVVLIDYPGFHWWVAARAKAMEIPVISFVPPQIWAWASHRSKKMRATFDHILCALPFEEAWFRGRGISASYIGHPYFDELQRQQLDAAFLSRQRLDGGPVVGILPGSRGHEVVHNLETMIRTARVIHHHRPDVRFLFACFSDKHRKVVANRLGCESLPAEVCVGKTPEIIELSEACVSVSGSVSLELLHRLKPTVVVYRTTAFYHRLTRIVKNVPYISLVNLLADREVFPEYFTSKDEGDGPAGHVLTWLGDMNARQKTMTALKELKSRVAQPGACASAASYLIDRFASGLVRAA